MYFKTETFVGTFILLALGLFTWMSFQLGSVRLNLARYTTYTVAFKDVANLLAKADIKISGVKVGWVESVFLDPEDMRVKVTVKVLKDYKIYQDASAFIRQEGLLGVKYLEIIPGTADSLRIPPHGVMSYQESSPAAIDEIFASVTTLAKQIERLGTSLEESNQEARAILKEIRSRLSSIDKVFSDVGGASESFKEAAAAVKSAGEQVSELLGFGEVSQKDAQSLVTKLTRGQGSLTKLIADDQLYTDIKCTSDYARSCIERVQSIGLGIDSHLELLPNSYCEPFHKGGRKTDVKWYGEGYLASRSGVFGKVGLTYSTKGYAKHEGDILDRRLLIQGSRNGMRLNLQVGKYWYPYVALRTGIFEGTAGLAIDGWLWYDRMKWLSTFEIYDFRGYNRFDSDRRPHLKWLNRLFVTDSFYLSFGADDFISCSNKSGFIGFGGYFSVPDFISSCG